VLTGTPAANAIQVSCQSTIDADYQAGSRGLGLHRSIVANHSTRNGCPVKAACVDNLCVAQLSGSGIHETEPGLIRHKRSQACNVVTAALGQGTMPHRALPQPTPRQLVPVVSAGRQVIHPRRHGNFKRNIPCAIATHGGIAMVLCMSLLFGEAVSAALIFALAAFP
jgi:hypothetical protein